MRFSHQIWLRDECAESVCDLSQRASCTGLEEENKQSEREDERETLIISHVYCKLSANTGELLAR